MALLARLGHPYVVLGNHDYALTRDPFSKPVDLLRLAHGTLLADETVELAGVDARSWMRRRRSGFETESDADLRVLLGADCIA